VNIKGQSRAGGRELAAHLLNAEKNETISIVRVSGTVAQDLPGAFAEMEAVASGTRCQKSLYHAKISPDPKEPRLTPEQWDRAVSALADELGMDGNAYVFVLHRKYGKFTPDVLREHGHVVFSRIDPETMTAVHDGHNYRKHEIVARQLEREFGHARIQGAHAERNGHPRPERTPPEWEMQRATISGINPRDVGATVRRLWSEARTPQSFAAALPQKGLRLAIGKRDLVVLDPAGDVHTLARCLGVKVADIRAKLAGIDRATLPTVEQAREALRAPKAQKDTPAPIWDRDQANRDWHDALIDAAIAKAAAEGTPAGGRKKDGQGEGLPDVEREALREKLAAFGFDAKTNETLEKWEQLGGKVEAGTITEKDRLREIASHLWHETDRERRAEKQHQPQQRPREPEREP
jgi:hypothetical protein